MIYAGWRGFRSWREVMRAFLVLFAKKFGDVQTESLSESVNSGHLGIKLASLKLPDADAVNVRRFG